MCLEGSADNISTVKSKHNHHHHGICGQELVACNCLTGSIKRFSTSKACIDPNIARLDRDGWVLIFKTYVFFVCEIVNVLKQKFLVWIV